MTRTVTPQPAAHIGQMLGFHSATPGTTSSSETKRMSWCSGLPQLASVALVPVIAVSLMKSRRSIALAPHLTPPPYLTSQTHQTHLTSQTHQTHLTYQTH